MNIGIVIFPGVEELDFVGPWEVFTVARTLTTGASFRGSHPPLTGKLPASEGLPSGDSSAAVSEVMTLAATPGPVQAAKGLRVLPDVTFDDAPRLDVLLVPGGEGTRREENVPGLVAFIRKAAPGCRWVASVCTGAGLLQQAGLLENRRATTHWAHTAELESRGGVTVVKHTRYVRDGNVVTSAGVSAGIDMALWLVGQLWDPGTARRVQRTMEYDPAPPYAAET